MTKLIVTQNLISDVSLLNEELKLNINIEKITFEEFQKEKNISLFKSNDYKYIFDKFVTYSQLNKEKYDFEENYIFQIKKQNLSKFSDESKEVDVHYIEVEPEKEIFPWDFTNMIFSSKSKLAPDVVDYFCNNENTFRQFLNYFLKELIRLKLAYSHEEDEIAEVLKEKVDYKYKLVRERKKFHSLDEINKSIENIYKIEKLIIETGYNPENSKRFIISSKALLQF